MAAAGSAAGRAPQTVADATHDLYRQYGKQIYAYCLHQLRSREEAEDAVQTTFLNAFRGLQRGTTTRFEQAWLYKIAQNVCIARRSSSGRRLRLESPDDFEILQEVVPTPASAEGDTLELMGLDAALDSMPENQRRAILMREWQGMSYREVATELGLTQGAVEMLIFRARRTLAHALEQPAAEKKRASRARAGFSLGSIVAAMQPLFSTGAAAKVAAVAVAAAVVGTNGAVHSVISHAETPARKAAVTATRPQLTAVRTFVAAKPAVGIPTPRKPVKAAVPRRTAPAPETPVGAPDVEPVPPSAPAEISTPTTAPTSAPPAQMPAPALQQTPAATSAPPTQADSPQTESQRPPIAPAESGTAAGADATGDGQPVQTHDVENTRDTQDVPQPPSDGTTTTTAPVTTSTPPRDAVASSTPVVPDSNPAPPPTPTTTTTTTATTTTTPSTPPVPQTTAPGDGRHGDGGRHGHH